MKTQELYKELVARFDATMQEHAAGMNHRIINTTRETRIWDALITKTKLPEGLDTQLTSLVYDRTLPTIKEESNADVKWCKFGGSDTFTEEQGESQPVEPIPEGEYIRFKKRMRNYYLSVANIKSHDVPMSSISSPERTHLELARVDIDMEAAVKRTQHDRLQECFEQASGNIVTCSEDTKILGFSYGDDVRSVDPATVTHNLASKVLDNIHGRLTRTTDHKQAYGTIDKSPVFALVIGDQASNVVKRECGITEGMVDVTEIDERVKVIQYKREAFRGFFHVINATPPRYTEHGGKLVRVWPFDVEGGDNPAYNIAEFEVAYGVHRSVMEYQVPSDDPEDYIANFLWLNIETTKDNLCHDKGVFYTTMAGAAKPIKCQNGFTVIFRRDSLIIAQIK